MNPRTGASQVAFQRNVPRLGACRTAARSLGKYRNRNLAFVRWSDTPHALPSSHEQKRGEIMELLELEPPRYGVRISGIYVIDDDGTDTLAGPFDSETAAIRWIDQLRDALTACHSTREPATSW
jgi:hypothetical protein